MRTVIAIAEVITHVGQFIGVFHFLAELGDNSRWSLFTMHGGNTSQDLDQLFHTFVGNAKCMMQIAIVRIVDK